MARQVQQQNSMQRITALSLWYREMNRIQMHLVITEMAVTIIQVTMVAQPEIMAMLVITGMPVAMVTVVQLEIMVMPVTMAMVAQQIVATS